jgi:hypothetical protein
MFPLNLKGLPRSRDRHHTIPLKEGSVPPRSRSYIVSYKQKNEVEPQLHKQENQKLMHEKVIGKVRIPYASLVILVLEEKKWTTYRLCVI